ncbi:MAG: hypothetical protein ACI9UJ_001729 [bacterium]
MMILDRRFSLRVIQKVRRQENLKNLLCCHKGLPPLQPGFHF